MKVEIYQKGDKDHQDSFWFDGLVAETENFLLYATGEIRIYKEDELIYDGKSRGSGFYPATDKDLPYDDNGEIWFDYNNWFEIVSKEDSSDMGLVCDQFDEAIEELKRIESEEK